MSCRLCQGHKMRLELMEEHINTLEEKNNELRKINDTLLKNLETCKIYENWKIKCEVLIEQNHKLTNELARIKAKQKDYDFYSKNQNQNIELKSQLKDQPLTLAKTQFSTPKNRKTSLSYEKMNNFMSTMKKNIFSRKRTDSSTAPTRFSSQKCATKDLKSQTNDRKMLSKNNEKYQKANITKRTDHQYEKKLPVTRQWSKSQFLNESNSKMMMKNMKPKTFLQILVFQ